ncbi:MAG: MtaA/CmuA family methyltransferase [Dehalococcoidia bacterium]|jgi:[methyl-Co(III) methanol-specific corrinoid protein]:coenzyme M methyltransferase
MDVKRRLLAALDGEAKGDPPVICPGGMMSMSCREVGERNGDIWLEAHTSPTMMARLATDMAEATGFENVGVPFCVTVEAEALGGFVDYGSARVEPRITDFVLESPGQLSKIAFRGTDASGRMPVVLEAISMLKERQSDLPVVGNLTGPISLANSLMDPNAFLRLMIRDKPFTRDYMELLTEAIAAFGEAEAKAGADVISIGDPTASGDILGTDLFEEFALPSMQRIVSRIKKQGARTILHICGNIKPILSYMKATGADALSFDAAVPIKMARSAVGDWALMGNVSTFLLAGGPPDSITRATRRVIREGIDIVSPACGLSTGTPAAYVKIMTDAVRQYRLEKQEAS